MLGQPRPASMVAQVPIGAAIGADEGGMRPGRPADPPAGLAQQRQRQQHQRREGEAPGQQFQHRPAWRQAPGDQDREAPEQAGPQQHQDSPAAARASRRPRSSRAASARRRRAARPRPPPLGGRHAFPQQPDRERDQPEHRDIAQDRHPPGGDEGQRHMGQREEAAELEQPDARMQGRSPRTGSRSRRSSASSAVVTSAARAQRFSANHSGVACASAALVIGQMPPNNRPRRRGSAGPAARWRRGRPTAADKPLSPRPSA